jgi:probable rRNA maturation factor
MIELTVEESVEGLIGAADQAWLEAAIVRLWVVAGIQEELLVGLVLTDDEQVQELNATFRGVDATTDVLSFVLAEGGEAVDGCLGDIVVSVPQAIRQAAGGEHELRLSGERAATGGWVVRQEIFFLVVHGLLHLLGYDHGTPEEDLQMRSLEKKYYFESLTAEA